MIARTHLELHEQFQAASQEQLLDPVWMEETLRPHCKLKYLGWRGSRLRVIQHPKEFAQFLILMAQSGVRSYLEIGTSTGGSFLAVDAYLRAAVRNYECSVGYDRTDKMRTLPEYQARFPSVQFRHQGSRNMDVSAERFDAAFIDARHIERWVIHDFGKVAVSDPRLIGFHDILRGGVRDAWKTLKEGRMNVEFKVTDIPEVAQCGIGVLVRNGEWSPSKTQS